ncbi:BAG family molecular chaperone regulator 1-like [Ananas comosus]|uniref:BAG family molecular chaperone regulator 1-like n=1 Tax=Ananas comosus TaxID=4615 RepID=A0A6P5GZQ6_ANACO|nr:BAG family molecular chaperone regulator 1-like [Ananas comosus]
MVRSRRLRPSGLLVQKRHSVSEGLPAIRVKVKHAGVHHEIYISPQATFGELKKMVSARTGLHPEDQKLVFKHRERDSKSFLDICGVKDRSKIVLLEDPSAQARRLLQLRRTDNLHKAARSVSRIGLDVDKLASEVSALDRAAREGGKVAEDDVIRLTEMLMNELIKLDAVPADGDVKAQRRMQVERVQKYVATLDAIKNKNEQIDLTPNWEQFDLLSSMPSTSSAASTATASAAAPIPRFDWELF